MIEKKVEGGPAVVTKTVGEIRPVKDQAKIREILGDARMNELLEWAANEFKGSGTGIYVFLIFTDEGGGQVRIYNREDINPNDDNAPDANCIRRKLAKWLGSEEEDRLYSLAVRLMGWTY